MRLARLNLLNRRFSSRIGVVGVAGVDVFSPRRGSQWAGTWVGARGGRNWVELVPHDRTNFRLVSLGDL